MKQQQKKKQTSKAERKSSFVSWSFLFASLKIQNWKDNFKGVIKKTTVLRVFLFSQEPVTFAAR